MLHALYSWLCLASPSAKSPGKHQRSFSALYNNSFNWRNLRSRAGPGSPPASHAPAGGPEEPNETTSSWAWATSGQGPVKPKTSHPAGMLAVVMPGLAVAALILQMDPGQGRLSLRWETGEKQTRGKPHASNKPSSCIGCHQGM